MFLALSILIVRLLLTPAADSASLYVQKFEARYRSAKTLETTFLERYSENQRVVRTEAGVAYFRRPGKMRWEYAAPEKNLFLVDGKTAWFYVPADHSVTKVPASRSQDWRTPIALLAGEMKVSRVCERIEVAGEGQPEDPALILLKCIVRGTQAERKAGKATDTAFFEIAKATGELSRVVVESPGGVRMELQFTNWKYDSPAGDDLFRFQAPKGVAIVDGEGFLPGLKESQP